MSKRQARTGGGEGECGGWIGGVTIVEDGDDERLYSRFSSVQFSSRDKIIREKFYF